MKWNENEYMLLVKTQPSNSPLRNIPLKLLHVLTKTTCKRMFSAIFLIVQNLETIHSSNKYRINYLYITSSQGTVFQSRSLMFLHILFWDTWLAAIFLLSFSFLTAKGKNANTTLYKRFVFIISVFLSCDTIHCACKYHLLLLLSVLWNWGLGYWAKILLLLIASLCEK